MPSQPNISDLELVARLCLAVLLCGLIGIERESRDQPAGLRTHILVGLGAALFTLVSAYAFEEFRRAAPGNRPTTFADPTRIAAQVVAGIGFLGAGAILRQGISVRGLTTAAALWISAAIGMAAGAGYYVGAIATTLIVLASLVGLRTVRSRIVPLVRTDYVLLELTTTSAESLSDILSALAESGVQVETMSVQHENGLHRYTLELRAPPPADLSDALAALRRLEDVREVAAHGVRGPVGGDL